MAKTLIGDKEFAVFSSGGKLGSPDSNKLVSISTVFFNGALAAGARSTSFDFFTNFVLPFNAYLKSVFVNFQYADSTGISKAMDRASLLITLPGGTMYQPPNTTLGANSSFVNTIRIAGNPDSKEIEGDFENIYIPSRQSVVISGTIYYPAVTVLNDSLLAQCLLTFKVA